MSRKQGKHNQRKQEKKRRVERAKRLARSEPLAYHGSKYRTDELVPLHLQTETGIYHAFVASKRKLTDAEVESALRRLILQLRRGSQPSLDDASPGESETAPSLEEEMVLLHIRLNWQRMQESGALPGRDTLVGVLRSILGSIETWKHAGAESRGYLEYIEGFLGRMGVHAESLPEEALSELEWADEEEEDEEEDEEEANDEELPTELAGVDDLEAIGRAWYRDDSPQVERHFHGVAQKMIESGQAAEVAEICRRLIAESPRRSVNADLTALALEADRAHEPEK